MRLSIFLCVVLLMTALGCRQTDSDYSIKPKFVTVTFNTNNNSKSLSHRGHEGAFFFPAGFKANIYITENSTVSPLLGGTPSVVTSDGKGDLISEKPVALREGLYDIFSISENISHTPELNISNGWVTGLVNGKDYLMAKKSALYIHKSTSVSLLFNHIASRILLFVTSEDIQYTVSIISFKITLPVEQECILNLSDETISPARTMGPYTEISGYGNTREVLLLPSLAYPQFKLEVELTSGVSPPVVKSYSGVINHSITGGITYEAVLKIKKDLQLKTEISFYPTRIMDNHIIFKSITN